MTLSLLLLRAQIRVPLGLDAYVPAPDTNPITVEKILLGKKLFFDKRLSADSSIACASCHDPAQAFTDRNPVALGIRNQKGPRRSPRLINRAWGRDFFWDGRAPSLEAQVLQPIANPLEMASTPEAAALRVSLTVTELRNALATYVRSIVSGNSPYDRYLAGETTALSTIQLAGLQLFRGKAQCIACHMGPNLTDERFHNTGAGNATDLGRAGKFKTPGLREAARTAPYMHDGSIATLAEVIDFYDQGGAPKRGELDPDIVKLNLSAGEKQALLAFLEALNGQVRHGL